MQGLVNRAIQCFVRDIYGLDTWNQVVEEAQLGFSSFEAMLDYDPSVTDRVVSAVQASLSKPRSVVLEDLGTYLVSHANMETLRRLLRFGGSDFEEFLLSLDELPDKARLILPDFVLPALSVQALTPRMYELVVGGGMNGFSCVLMGVLRVMSDDYGALAFFEHRDGADGNVIQITLADSRFSQGRSFDLTPAQEASYG